MARGEIQVHFRIRTITGLASCDVCSSLISFQLAGHELLRIDALRCPRCSGSATADPDSLFAELEILSASPAPEKGRT